MSEGQGEIPLIGEMSAKQTKGSAVFAEEAVSGEEAVAFATGGCCQSDPTTLRQLRLRSLPPPLGKGGLDVCLFHGDSAQKMP